MVTILRNYKKLSLHRLLHGRSKLKSILISLFSIILLYIVFSSAKHDDIVEAKERILIDSNSDIFRFGGFVNDKFVDSIDPHNEIEAHLTRQSNRKSVFYYGSLHAKFMDDWPHMTKLNRCQYLVSKLLDESASWSHKNIDSDSDLTTMVESMRIHNSCFLDKDFTLTDVLENEKDFNDYLTYMFPYLAGDKSSSVKITKHNLISNEIQNLNFKVTGESPWSSWVKQSKGQGIVTTMDSSDVKYFVRLLRVLKKLNNQLPIQIVTANDELSSDTMNLIIQEAKNTNQQVEVIDCSGVLNKEFVNLEINGYLNKWIATIFNTFEEFIFLDVDAVPFVPITDFFKIEQYRKSGIYMYRDRAINHEHLPKSCIESLFNIEPSMEEEELIGSKWKYNLRSKTLGNMVSEGIEEEIFNSFFFDLNYHQVDSGLVVIRKDKKTLGGLLMSFQLNLANVIKDCVHGDKEFFWLGQLIAGNDYSIDAIGPGALGAIYEDSSVDTHAGKRYGVCATQIGHYGMNDKLMWVNGGLKVCKNEDAAVTDFVNYEEFMTGRYETVEKLQDIYNSVLHIDGIIIPETQPSPWVQTRECSQYRFCASVDIPSGSIKPNNGKLIRFNKNELSYYNEIAELWSQ